MEKLSRFMLLTFFYVLLFICLYSLIPFVVWVFGGSFTAVAQSVLYVLAGSTIIPIVLGIIFNECFDSDFYTKKN